MLNIWVVKTDSQSKITIFSQELKEAKAELRDHVKHLPDGHRGSIASVTERPPYRPIPKETTD